MKKTGYTAFTLILVLAFLAGAVTGCGTDTDNSSNNNQFDNTLHGNENGNENPNQNGNNQNQPNVFPAPIGKLTVTNLVAFNDKYIFVQGLVGGSTVLTGITDITGYPSDITYKLVKISNDKAEIPMYMANSQATSYSTSYVPYNGSDPVTSLSVIILNESSLKSSNASNAVTNNLGLNTFTSNSFLNGNMAAKWVWKLPAGVVPVELEVNKIIRSSLPYKNASQWFFVPAGNNFHDIYLFNFFKLNQDTIIVRLYTKNGVIDKESKIKDNDLIFSAIAKNSVYYYLFTLSYVKEDSYIEVFNKGDGTGNFEIGYGQKDYLKY